MSHVKNICIYHDHCTDGFGAAWVVSLALPRDNMEFYPASYNQPPPDVANKNVYIVDFSYPADVLREMAKVAVSVTILDHHKTAQASLQPLLDTGVVDGVFDMSRSGAMIAWDWFFDEPKVEPPQLLKHIQDRDLWKFELPDTLEIITALNLYPFNIDDWDVYMGMFGYQGDEVLKDFVEQGRLLVRQRQSDIDTSIKYGKRSLLIGGVLVPAVNTLPQLASDTGSILCRGYPFAATYYDSGSKRKFSLRSEKGGWDVSAIAKLYGGGGHEHAAGFEMHILDAEMFETNLDVYDTDALVAAGVDTTDLEAK